MEPTYLKRARQLVKNQRAEWISEATIRMKLPYVEENLMTTENIALKDVESATNVDSEDILNIQTPDDNTILELAKRRLGMKKNLFYQTMDYILILLCIASIVVIWDANTKFLIGFIFTFFWGARLLYRIFKFAMPSFKDGIATYIKKRNNYQLESEFNRLKKEYLSNH